MRVGWTYEGKLGGGYLIGEYLLYQGTFLMVTIRPALKIKQKRLRTFLFHILLKRTVSVIPVIPDELPYKKGEARFTTGLFKPFTVQDDREFCIYLQKNSREKHT